MHDCMITQSVKSGRMYNKVGGKVKSHVGGRSNPTFKGKVNNVEFH